MAESFIGEIRIFAGNFPPNGWAFCSGALLPISQNTALFSLLGTTYGGNGQTNFALPDLQGRAPIHAGMGPGLSNYELGQTGGSEIITLLANNLPVHTHGVNGVNDAVNQAIPGPGTYPGAAAGGRGQRGPSMYAASGTAATTLAPESVSPAGGSQPVSIMKPVQTVNYIIALQGIYPSRP